MQALVACFVKHCLHVASVSQDHSSAQQLFSEHVLQPAGDAEGYIPH